MNFQAIAAIYTFAMARFFRTLNNPSSLPFCRPVSISSSSAPPLAAEWRRWMGWPMVPLLCRA